MKYSVLSKHVKILLLVLCISVITLPSVTSAQGADTTVLKAEITKLKSKVDSLTTAVAVASEKNKTLQEQKDALGKGCVTCEAPTWQQKIFALTPVILFLFVFFFIVGWARRQGFSIASALSAEEPITIKEEQKDAAGNPTGNIMEITYKDANGNPVFVKSTSRFIALFSGLAGIIIALSLVSSYTYYTIRGITIPDYKNLFEIILGLGIGVVPYAFNKFTESKPATQ